MLGMLVGDVKMNEKNNHSSQKGVTETEVVSTKSNLVVTSRPENTEPEGVSKNNTSGSPEKTLFDKIENSEEFGDLIEVIPAEDVKASIKNAEKKLKDMIKNKKAQHGNYSFGYMEDTGINIIEQVFKEEFGGLREWKLKIG